MPFTYRRKPNLADRLRGKVGEEVLNELQNDLDSEERRMFFDSPSWRTRHSNSEFPRGFPFSNDQNRINIRSYLNDIACRYPEFADQLKERPWTKDYEEPSFKQAGTVSQSDQSNEPSGSTHKSVEEKEPQQNLTNFGLRNTVPLGPGASPIQSRHQRSMSAPPENRGANHTKRFVTKCEIPVMNNPMQDPVQVKPDFPGRAQPESVQQKANNAPNVRVIPIQVEGRDTPLVNTNIDTATNFGAESFVEPSFEGRLPRDFGSYQRHSPRFAHKERAPTPQYQYAPQYQQYVPPQQHFMPPQQPQFTPQQHFGPSEQQIFVQQQQQKPAPTTPSQFQQSQQQQPPHQQQQQQQQEHHGTKTFQGDETNVKVPQAKPEPVKDPIEKVQAIQKDVEELMKQVEAFKGNSRTDKQYLMLDELLTRQLLLLDNIDTEGKENVRQARKDTIRSIQKCISTLENKVPIPETNNSTSDSKNQEVSNNNEVGGTQPMNVDSTKENSPVESKEPQKMEVDEEGNRELKENKPDRPQSQEKEQQEQAKDLTQN